MFAPERDCPTASWRGQGDWEQVTGPHTWRPGDGWNSSSLGLAITRSGRPCLMTRTTLRRSAHDRPQARTRHPTGRHPLAVRCRPQICRSQDPFPPDGRPGGRSLLRHHAPCDRRHPTRPCGRRHRRQPGSQRRRVDPVRPLPVDRGQGAEDRQLPHRPPTVRPLRSASRPPPARQTAARPGVRHPRFRRDPLPPAEKRRSPPDGGRWAARLATRGMAGRQARGRPRLRRGRAAAGEDEGPVARRHGTDRVRHPSTPPELGRLPSSASGRSTPAGCG